MASAATWAFCAAWRNGAPIAAIASAGLAVFVIVGTLSEAVMRAWRPGGPGGVALKRAAGLPLSFWGASLAHVGVGVTLLGLSGVGFGAEAIATLHKGARERVGPYEIVLDSIGERGGPNYRETVTTMTVHSRGDAIATIEPARRQFLARQTTTTEAGMATLDFGQIYVSIADPTPDGGVPARLYWKPLVTLIWLGGCAMSLGGAVSLADRRLRFGVPARARSAAAVAAE